MNETALLFNCSASFTDTSIDVIRERATRAQRPWCSARNNLGSRELIKIGKGYSIVLSSL